MQCVVGWSTGLAESAMTVADAVRHAATVTKIKPYGGVFNVLYTDGGSGNTAKINTDEFTGLFARITAMMSFKDDEGRPLNTIPNILLVPPALKDIANILATNEKLDDGKPNPYRGTLEVVVNARLTSATAWFLLDTTKPVRPFIYQERKKPVFVQQIDPQADDVFMRKKFKFGAEARCSGGYGFWQLIWGSDGSVA